MYYNTIDQLLVNRFYYNFEPTITIKTKLLIPLTNYKLLIKSIIDQYLTKLLPA